MPPRIAPHRLTEWGPCQCFRTRPRDTSSTSSQFHTTPRNATRLRRDMYAWLNGPGKAFRDPLPGSTNYLSAYDRKGGLARATRGEQEKYNDPELDEKEATIQARELEEGLSQDAVKGRAAGRERKRQERREMEERGGIPKERPSDMRPYPLNHQFRSQPVLSEALRNKIFELVVDGGLDLKAVSAAYNVDIRRVAAVVRLKSLEKQWVTEGKLLAKPYNDAVLAMLPQTAYKPGAGDPPPHESINDLPVHAWTKRQIFLPTSESRAFTREAAAKTFHPTLLPADKRIAHPELIQQEKWNLEGHSMAMRVQLRRDHDAEVAQEREEKERKQREYEARTQVVVKGRRWDFKFEDVSAEKVNKDGRGRDAIGLRYGFPLEDRKRGQIKIPTSVE